MQTKNELSILFDQPPEAVVKEGSLLSLDALPAVAADLPTSLLGRRPDLQADELRLRAALSNVDASKASFYPTFVLTGSQGTSSALLGTALQNPVTTFGVGLTLPFVQWNTMKLTIKVSENQYAEAVTNFRQHLYTALAEVEDALSARTQFLAEEEKLKLSLDQAQRAEQLTQTRYRAGAINAQLWLDAQQKIRVAKLALAQNRFNQLNNYVKLHKSLGDDIGQVCVDQHFVRSELHNSTILESDCSTEIFCAACATSSADIDAGCGARHFSRIASCTIAGRFVCAPKRSPGLGELLQTMGGNRS